MSWFTNLKLCIPLREILRAIMWHTSMVYQRNIVTDMNKLLWVVSYTVEKDWARNSIFLQNKKWLSIFPWLQTLNFIYFSVDKMFFCKWRQLTDWVISLLIFQNIISNIKSPTICWTKGSPPPLLWTVSIYLPCACPVPFQSIYHLGFLQ